MDLRAILPSTIYPQSTMNPNNFTYICNNHLYPYSAIGLVIYETEGLTRYCTGSLIYKNIVLTSSICCYNY
jgi:V8-like Glu-specific endopeptidase